MFTTGRWIFIGFFVALFVAAMIWSYRKDLKLHKKQYKGSIWVLVGFIIFLLLLLALKQILDL
ncbi:MAG: hypothetical protein ABJM06_04190 [Gilvibacter sp.]